MSLQEIIETQRRKGTEVTENPLSYQIIGAAIEVHQTLGGPYLRLTGLRLGLLINFGSKYVKEGIKRVIND